MAAHPAKTRTSVNRISTVVVIPLRRTAESELANQGLRSLKAAEKLASAVRNHRDVSFRALHYLAVVRGYRRITQLVVERYNEAALVE